MAEILVQESEARVVDGVGECVGILVESHEAAVVAQTAHNGARMTTAAEGNVNIRSLGADVQSFDALLEHHRLMVIVRHCPSAVPCDELRRILPRRWSANAA